MTDDNLHNQWQWRGMVLPEGWPDVPEAPTELAESTDSAESNESKDSQESNDSEHIESDEIQNSSRKRSLILADEVPDISDASRQALREAAG